jgi:hypothetical protein
MPMKYYRQSEHEVLGYDEKEQSALIAQAIAAGWTDISESWPPKETDSEKWAAYQAKARAALTDSDTSMLRIYEAVILGATTMEAADVVAFVKWRQALRAILSAAQHEEIPDALPAMPGYPVGTGTTA